MTPSEQNHPVPTILKNNEDLSPENQQLLEQAELERELGPLLAQFELNKSTIS